jgi:two-component system, chemotaxis family, chemotaxis protein CheY
MRHCLVVDDSEIVRKVAHGLIEELGLTSTESDSADDALVRCQRAMPDAILLDWQMPGTSSHEFLAKLREMPGGHRPVVIYCTSENDPDDVARAIRGGAKVVLMKPFDQDAFSRALKDAGMSSAALDYRTGGSAGRRIRQREAEFGGL